MKNERQQRILFIIPAVIIAIILIICIAVAVGSKSGNKGNKKDSRSVSVTENEQDIVAESEMLELVKEDALKESNVEDKPEASNQTAAPEPAQSEPAQPETPKNEYVAPGWIFYGSKAGNGMSGEQKAYVDSVIQQWTNGGLSDDAIGDMFIEKIAQEWQLPMITAGVTSNLLCLFQSRAEVTDYSLNLADMNGTYNFVGLYTKGEYDENGYLKCYYWEAGVL